MSKKSRRKYFNSFYNTISFAGTFLAVLVFGIILLLILLERFSDVESPYVGVITYIIMPVFLIIGLFLIPIGMWREHSRRKRGLAAERLPRLDLNDPQHRRGTVIFLSATAIFSLFTAFGTYRAFEFTDSVTFCGEMCHDVMEPEYTAYQTSPHARVKCVDCHVGTGAEWFVRSKLSGAHQVIAVLFNTYERPIPTPISNLRPARETCEQCHWPEKFYGNKQTDRVHFMADENNTRWHYNMLLKIGGINPDGKIGEAIHWHIDNRVEYIATDARRQNIPWVRVTYPDGSQRVYKSEGNDFDESQMLSQIKTMDCIDCHNRPSHIFQLPQLAVNRAIEDSVISPLLPYIKSTAVSALEQAEKEPTVEQALAVIRQNMTVFYDSHEELKEKHGARIERSINEVENIYRRNFFPKMQASWRAYPNNIGHFNAPGCYRCHDGNHFAENGDIITNDCNACHVIIEQAGGEDFHEQNLYGLVFKHPEDIDEEWRVTGCYECHGE